jgi:Cft2 family RNA processing exonuclease
LKFINLTRRTEIGANSYYLEMGRHRLVLDSGMHPKDTGEDALPNFKAIAGQEIAAILISHAHQDHIGTLPVLMRRFPTAHIFMTEATAEIARRSVALSRGHIHFSRIEKPIAHQNAGVGVHCVSVSPFPASARRSARKMH